MPPQGERHSTTRTHRLRAGFLMLLALAATCASPSLASAAEFPVDDLGDAGDGTCATATCTLRDAILDANATPGADLITVIVSGTITPTAPLPLVTGATTVTAEDAPGATPSAPSVGLDLGAAGPSEFGLDFRGNGASVVRNLAIHGNPDVGGVRFTNGLIDCRVEQSWFGIDVTGAADGLLTGVQMLSGGTIGGVGLGNRFAAVRSGAVDVVGGDVVGVRANTFGVLPGGGAAGNESGDVFLSDAAVAAVGGPGAGEGNVFGESPRAMQISGVTGSLSIAGNRLGVQADGVTPTPGGAAGGIAVDGQAAFAGGYVVGGPTASHGNVLAGSDIVVFIRDPGDDLVVRNNRVGVGSDDATAFPPTVPGARAGLTIFAAGTALIADNTVAVSLAGIYVSTFGAGVPDVSLVRNRVGTNALRAPGLGNAENGIEVESDVPSRVAIGGATADANVIRSNGQAGIRANTIGPVAWRRNSISVNGELAVDSGAPGVNAQDGGDPANGGQTTPVLTLAEQRGGTLHIEGTLRSPAGRAQEVDLYRNTACDASGTGEAETYLDTVSLTGNGGATAFSRDLDVTLPAGEAVTAISTDVDPSSLAGASSEVSGCRAVTRTPEPPPPPDPTPPAPPEQPGPQAQQETAPSALPPANVDGTSDVTTTLTLLGLPATVGRPLTHRLTLRNTGTGIAKGTRALLDLPPGTSVGAARLVPAGSGASTRAAPAAARQASSSLTCTTVAQRTSCPVGDIPPGASRTVEIEARPRRTGTYRASGAAAEDSSGQPGPASARQTPALASPSPAETANLATVRGTVLVRLPGSARFVDVRTARQVPIGSTIDTRGGRVSLVTAAGRGGLTRQADFYDGLFRVRQPKSAAITDLRLVEPLATCARYGAATARAAARRPTTRRPRARRLWGSGGSGHRTTGQNAAATVRGTIWLVQDRCDGSTRVQVREGSVSVRVVGRRRTVVVRAPQSYLAPARPARRRG